MSTNMAKPSSQGLPPLKRSAVNAPGTPGILGELQSEVSVEAAPLLQFIAKHAAVIMVVLGLFVATVVGIGVWQWYASKRDEEARTHLARLLLQQQGAARVHALENFAATAPNSIRLVALVELGLAALTEKDAAKAAAAFARVADLDKNKPFGAMTALSEAQTLMQADKAAEALAVLEALEHTVPEMLRIQVRGLIALSARQAGKTDRAIKAYEDLLAGALGDDADYYRFCIRQIKADAAK
jgi:predicted negative regulator of RcsB-dependent stress response